MSSARVSSVDAKLSGHEVRISSPLLAIPKVAKCSFAAVVHHEPARIGTLKLNGTARNVKVYNLLPSNTPEAPISREGLSVQSVTTALIHAARAWDKYDSDRSGCLSLKEAVDLLNSHELQDAALLLTNVAFSAWTESDLQPLFAKADTDKSGALTRTEFLALYLAVSTQRVKKNPLVLAEALMGFLDSDRNGRIEGKELKVLLTMLGFPLAVILPIPTNIGVDYRSILNGLARTQKKR